MKTCLEKGKMKFCLLEEEEMGEPLKAIDLEGIGFPLSSSSSLSSLSDHG